MRVLVPCYKESLGTISATVTAAMEADLPAGVSRVLYLCDDGKDPAKAEFIASLGDDARCDSHSCDLIPLHIIHALNTATPFSNGSTAHCDMAIPQLFYNRDQAASVCGASRKLAITVPCGFLSQAGM